MSAYSALTWRLSTKRSAVLVPFGKREGEGERGRELRLANKTCCIPKAVSDQNYYIKTSLPKIT